MKCAKNNMCCLALENGGWLSEETAREIRKTGKIIIIDIDVIIIIIGMQKIKTKNNFFFKSIPVR